MTTNEVIPLLLALGAGVYFGQAWGYGKARRDYRHEINLAVDDLRHGRRIVEMLRARVEKLRVRLAGKVIESRRRSNHAASNELLVTQASLAHRETRIAKLEAALVAAGACTRAPDFTHFVPVITGPNHDLCVYCGQTLLPSDIRSFRL